MLPVGEQSAGKTGELASFHKKAAAGAFLAQPITVLWRVERGGLCNPKCRRRHTHPIEASAYNLERVVVVGTVVKNSKRSCIECVCHWQDVLKRSSSLGIEHAHALTTTTSKSLKRSAGKEYPFLCQGYVVTLPETLRAFRVPVFTHVRICDDFRIAARLRHSEPARLRKIVLARLCSESPIRSSAFPLGLTAFIGCTC